MGASTMPDPNKIPRHGNILPILSRIAAIEPKPVSKTPHKDTDSLWTDDDDDDDLVMR
jgi:hypothetical protein